MANLVIMLQKYTFIYKQPNKSWKKSSISSRIGSSISERSMPSSRRNSSQTSNAASSLHSLPTCRTGWHRSASEEKWKPEYLMKRSKISIKGLESQNKIRIRNLTTNKEGETPPSFGFSVANILTIFQLWVWYALKIRLEWSMSMYL